MTTQLTMLTHQTPAGVLTTFLAGDSVRAAGFTTPESMRERHGLAEVPPAGDPDGSIGRQIQAWLDGDLAALDSVPVNQPGTDFQQAVWKALRVIPAGQTASYTELAEMAGRPTATRAVGTACGANAVAPFIPCHRAVRSDGSLGGYYYGLDAKRWLLNHEARAGLAAWTS